jgi:predicted kinase
MTLVVFGGLPGSGKTALARAVADALAATFIRLDAIEVAISVAGLEPTGAPVGYAVAHAVAADQLRAGRTVVVDAVNPVEVARAGWTRLADESASDLRFVEVTCSDVAEHRRRVESRQPDLPGHVVPTWAQVRELPYEPWHEPGLVVDNLGPIEAGVERILTSLLASCDEKTGSA